MRRCRRFLHPSLFFVIFYVFSLRKARILQCFGGGNGPKSAFWCPKGTCFMRFSKLPFGAGTHHQKHCFLRGKYGLCGLKKILFRSFRPLILGNVSAKSAPLVGLRHFAASGAPFVSVLKPKNVVFRCFASQKRRVFPWFRGLWSSQWWFLVPRRHVFYELFELLLVSRDDERNSP